MHAEHFFFEKWYSMIHENSSYLYDLICKYNSSILAFPNIIVAMFFTRGYLVINIHLKSELSSNFRLPHYTVSCMPYKIFLYNLLSRVARHLWVKIIKMVNMKYCHWYVWLWRRFQSVHLIIFKLHIVDPKPPITCVFS